MANFDENGLTVDSYSEIEQALTDALKASYGDNLRTDSQSVAGQLIKNFSLVHAELHELLQQVVDQSNPQSASGNALSSLVLLNGITRNPATYSQVTLSCTASAACTIPAGSLVSDAETAALWATKVDLVFAAAGTKTVAAQCTDAGPIEGGASTLVEIQTPVFGWASVTNPAPATLGRSIETDTELRLRRQQAAEKTSSSSTANLYRVLTEVPEVSFANVIANNSNDYDTLGIPPQHVLVVVDGGDDEDIAAAIFQNIAAGIGMSGSTIYDYKDPISGREYEVRFSRPIEINTYITINLKKNRHFPVDGAELVRQALLDYFSTQQTIGQDVIYSRLYSPINSIAGHEITSLYLDTSPAPVSVANITVPETGIAKTDPTYIVVNVS